MRIVVGYVPRLFQTITSENKAGLYVTQEGLRFVVDLYARKASKAITRGTVITRVHTTHQTSLIPNPSRTYKE